LGVWGTVHQTAWPIQTSLDPERTFCAAVSPIPEADSLHPATKDLFEQKSVKPTSHDQRKSGGRT
jgi:hypothetical protein